MPKKAAAFECLDGSPMVYHAGIHWYQEPIGSDLTGSRFPGYKIVSALRQG